MTADRENLPSSSAAQPHLIIYCEGPFMHKRAFKKRIYLILCVKKETKYMYFPSHREITSNDKRLESNLQIIMFSGYKNLSRLNCC
jgi:hypothetical protein